MYIYKIKNTLSLREGAKILSEIDKINESKIQIDLSELNYVDTTGSNFILLLPYYLRDKGHEVSINVNPDSSMTDWINSIGILDKFADSFDLTQNHKPQSVIDKQTIAKNDFQRRIYHVLNTNPLLRTFFANNKYDAQILSEIQTFSEKILMNRFKLSNRISTCVVELINNVFDHSEKNFGAIAIHFLKSQNKLPHLHLAVTDFGIGIKNSLLKSKEFMGLDDENDSFFIEKAIAFNVSSTEKANRGFGLSLVSQFADVLHINSGQGSISVRKIDGLASTKKRNIPNLIGTSITCILKVDEE